MLCLIGSAFAQTPTYYYQGRTKVEVQVHINSLAVKTTAPLSRNLQSKIGAALSVSNASPRVEGDHIMVAPSSTDLHGLTQAAQKIKKQLPNAKVRAVFYRDDTPDGNVEILTEEVSFKVGHGQTIKALTAKYKLTSVQSISYAKDTYIGVADPASGDLLRSLNTANAMQESGNADWATPVILKKYTVRALPNDPYFSNQWHLLNNKSNGNGNDLNVVPAWTTNSGEGVIIAITDDSLETAHADLQPNVRLDLSYDFISGNSDPNSAYNHGTRCAGVAAAVTDNALGVAGVAGSAELAGLQLIGGASLTDNQIAQALSWKFSEIISSNQIHINSNSWGPEDNVVTNVVGPDPLTQAAMETGIATGRNGKGIIYVWAGGNGRQYNDNINRDGFANSPYVIAVGATDYTGEFAYYSESGAALMVNAPGGETLFDGIYTTGANSTYTNNFTGTSAAAPGVAGVVALMLDANPNLTYRDVMHILIQTAAKNDPLDPTWIINGAGKNFSHDYGFGRANAGGAVLAAQTWINKPPAVQLEEVSTTPLVAIPDANPIGVSIPLSVTTTGTLFTEHVELEVNIQHSNRGDLTINLTSPSGTTSKLLLPRSGDTTDNLINWPLRSVAHWGENPNGTWTVQVIDSAGSNTGTVNGLILRIRGYYEPGSSVNNWGLY